MYKYVCTYVDISPRLTSSLKLVSRHFRILYGLDFLADWSPKPPSGHCWLVAVPRQINQRSLKKSHETTKLLH